LALAACTMANDHREAALLRRRLRRGQWHAFVGNDIGRGGRRVTVGFASLLSRSPRPWPTALRGSAAAPQPSWLWPARHGTALRWATEDCPVPAERRLRDCVRALPAFPPLATLTDDAVAAGVWALPLGRAAGPDGWSAEDLRLWPGELRVGLAELFRLVERCGRWPVARDSGRGRRGAPPRSWREPRRPHAAQARHPPPCSLPALGAAPAARRRGLEGLMGPCGG
jgi:hypothetical protein